MTPSLDRLFAREMRRLDCSPGSNALLQSVCSAFILPRPISLTFVLEGDISFQSQRRLWAQIGAALGANVFAYLFTQPQTQTPPSLGVYHGSEVRFVYGGVGPDASSDWHLSRAMIDYWVRIFLFIDRTIIHTQTRSLSQHRLTQMMVSEFLVRLIFYATSTRNLMRHRSLVDLI
jgi:hypothetical protein